MIVVIGRDDLSYFISYKVMKQEEDLQAISLVPDLGILQNISFPVLAFCPPSKIFSFCLRYITVVVLNVKTLQFCRQERHVYCSPRHDLLHLVPVLVTGKDLGRLCLFFVFYCNQNKISICCTPLKPIVSIKCLAFLVIHVLFVGSIENSIDSKNLYLCFMLKIIVL